MTVNATITTRMEGTFLGTADGAPVQNILLNERAGYTPGTTAGKADQFFFDIRTLAASGTDNLDLAGGITNAFGATITFVKVREIFIKADAGNTNNVVIGGAGSNTFLGPFSDASDKIAIQPGGILHLRAGSAGWTVTAGTGDILLVANSGGTTGVTYSIHIFGTTA